MGQSDLERLLRQIDPICERFEDELIAGRRPRIEDQVPEDWPRNEREFLVRHLIELQDDYLKISPAAGSDSDEESTDPGRSPFAASTDSPSLAGADRFELIEELGRGGMGVVYRARDRKLGREVALKTLRLDAHGDDTTRARFRAEAEATAALEHPNIVPVLDVGELAGQPFIAMRFLPGGTLAEHRARYRGDHEAIADLLINLAEAVQAAHARGILHRDLKLANVLLDEDRRPHVADFGLARRIEGHDGLTLSGQIVGTPHAMSPEQARGEGATLTVASDVYALGVMLFELLCGRPPFEGESVMSVVRQVIETPAPSPRSIDGQIPEDLTTITLKCLEKEPRARYSSARRLAEDLRAWREGRPIAARPVSRVERALMWARREPRLAIASLLALLLLVTLAVGGPLVAKLQSELRVRADREARVAEARRREIRRTLYSAEMVAAAKASFGEGAQSPLRDLLAHWNPRPDEEDLRGFEWYLHRGQLDHECFRCRMKVPLRVANPSLLAWIDDGDTLLLVDSWGLRRFRVEGESFVEAAAFPLPENTSVTSAHVDPAGERLAVVERGGDVLLIELATNAVRRIRSPGRAAMARWSPDGRRLLVAPLREGERANGHWVHDLETGEIIHRIEGRREVTHDAAFQPNGHLLAHSDDPRVGISISDLRDGSLRRIPNFALGVSFMRRFAWSPDGSRLAVPRQDRNLVMIDPETLAVDWELHWTDESPRCLAWNPDGRYVAIGGNDRAVTVVDVARREIAQRFRGHARGIDDLAWSPNGRFLASLDQVGELRIWRARPDDWPQDYRVDDTWEHGFSLIAAAPEGDVVAFGDRGKELILWEPMTRRERARVSTATWGLLADLEFEAEGQRLFVSGIGGQLGALDRRTGETLWTAFLPRDSRVMDIAVSPDGERLFVALAPGEMVEVSTADGAVRRRFGRAAFHTAVATDSSSGLLHVVSLESASHDGLPAHRVEVWDLATDELQGCVDLGQNIVNHLTPLGDGRMAAASSDGPVLVIDGRRRTIERALPGPTITGTAVSVSPDGRRLAGASDDGVLRVWDTETWRPVLEMLAHDGANLRGVAWVAGGEGLVTYGERGRVRFWSAARGRALGPVQNQTSAR